MKTKTKVLIAIASLLTVTSAIAGSGLMCRMCNGSGWRNGSKCIHCGGDGEVGS